MTTDFGRLQPGTLRVGGVEKVVDLPPPNDPSLMVGDRFNVADGPRIATLAQDGLGVRSWNIGPVGGAGSMYLANSGVGVLNAGGVLIVPDAGVTALSGFLFDANNGGAPLTGVLDQIGRTIGLDFTIASNAGPADAGVRVFWQRWEPA